MKGQIKYLVSWLPGGLGEQTQPTHQPGMQQMSMEVW